MESGDYARRVSNGNYLGAKMHENTPMIGDHRRNATARQNVNVTDRSADVDKGKKGQPGKKFFLSVESSSSSKFRSQARRGRRDLPSKGARAAIEIGGIAPARTNVVTLGSATP